jgi:hypothetical protein
VFVERIELPPNITGAAIRPTLVLLGSDGEWVSRPWGTKVGDASAKVVGTACIAAIPIVIFFFFDQNVSSLLCQIPEMNLRKGTYFHSSFVCMSLFNFIGPSLGMPFVTGSLPHSPQFVSALRENKGKEGDFVWENRLAPFIMYAI